MKKIAWYTVFSLVVMLMVVAVFIYIAPHIGWYVSAVVSGSMEPALETGSLVVTRPVDPEEIKVGDIITFNPVSLGERMMTHRVIDIRKNSPVVFQTQGDNCGMPDPFSVPAENLVGKICFHIPYGGNFTEFLKTPAGFISSVIVPGILVFILYVIGVWRAVIERKNQGAVEKIVS
jgi:signal peptidase